MTNYKKLKEEELEDTEYICKELIEKTRKETIEYERKRIKDWATDYIKKDMKIYGTDKYNISIGDLKEFLNKL